MTDPRIRTIRFWLLAGVLLVSLFIFPAWMLFMLPLPVLLMMPVFGATCIIWEDAFATDQLATAYTADAGSWAVASGAVSTSSSNARLRINATSATGHGRVSVKAKYSSSANPRLEGAYVDANNHIFIELVPGSGTVKLWKKVVGVDTQIGSTITWSFATNTYYTIEVCWDGAEARGLIYGIQSSVNSSAVATGAYTGTGTGACLATGTVSSGSVTFDDLVFEKHQTDDQECSPCGGAIGTCPENLMNCEEGIYPSRLAVTVDLTIDASLCDDMCFDDQGTYILPVYVQPPATHFDAFTDTISEFLLSDSDPPCDGDQEVNFLEQCAYSWRNVFDFGDTRECDDLGADFHQPNVFVWLLRFDDGYRLVGGFQWSSVATGSGLSTSWVLFISDVISDEDTPVNCMEQLDGVELAFHCSHQHHGLFGSDICTVSEGTMTVALP